MDELHAYATAKGIGLIAAVNSPGHMDALLVAMEKLGIENPQAQLWYGFKNNHGFDQWSSSQLYQSLDWQVYMDYFKDKSKIFNYGTDEYANDATSAQGWYYLKWYDLYGKFAEYSNSLAAMAREKACSQWPLTMASIMEMKMMLPLTRTSWFPYWSKGWWGYNLASPQYFGR